MKNKIKRIEKLGEKYFEEYLSSAVINRGNLIQNWYNALLFFFSKSFYRGRRDEISDKFKERTLEVMEDYYDGYKVFRILDSGELQKTLEKNGVNNHVDRRMVSETLKFLEKLPGNNIVSYSIERIRNGQAEEIHNELKQIYGIGDKLACLYLRDTALVYELEKFIQKKEQEYFQPIDTWVLQVARAIGLVGGDNKDLANTKQKIIDSCLDNKVSPLFFNAGAWYLGTHSFQLLLDVYSK